MGNQSTLLECWEAQRQVLCISEVGKLHVTLLRVTLHCSWLMGPHKLATLCSWWYFTIQSVLCCQNVSFQGWWLCCMLLLSNTSANFSGNESLKAHRHGHSFVVKCRIHKRAPTPLFGRLARWSAQRKQWTFILSALYGVLSTYAVNESSVCQQAHSIYQYVLNFTLVSVVTGGYIYTDRKCRFCYICHRKL